MTTIKLAVKNYSILLIIGFTLSSTNLFSQQKKEEIPEPVVVTPGKKGKAPSDAIILFNGENLDNFESVVDGSPANWKISGKKFTVVPGTNNIRTKEKFGDCQLHIEWKTPPKDTRQGKTSQQNGNSGIYLMSKYEIQVLNSYINKTGPKGQAGAFYSNFPPLVNASLKPGQWQTYDIIFKAPIFDENEVLKQPGSFTVIHNGVLVQNHVPIIKPTQAHNNNYSVAEKELPLMLQDHNNEVSYRNIWIRKL